MRTLPVWGIETDGFVYPEDTELERMRRTLGIIQRVEPGPHEDGVLFERLARQAATIEMSLADRDSDGEHAFRRVLIGTVGRPTARANSQKWNDHAIVTISSGFAYLVRRCAEAVSRLAAPAASSLTGMMFEQSSNVDELQARIAADPELVDPVGRPLISWLYQGSLAPPAPTPYAEDFSSSIVEDYAYRFVLAHEYAHVLIDELALPGWADAAQHDPEGKEINADAVALQVVLYRATPIDRVAMNIAAVGPMVAIKAREIVERAISVAQTGNDAPEDETAPGKLFEDRRRCIADVYRSLIAPDSDATHLAFEPADFAETVLEAVYQRVAAEARSRHQNGERLHETWLTN